MKRHGTRNSLISCSKWRARSALTETTTRDAPSPNRVVLCGLKLSSQQTCAASDCAGLAGLRDQPHRRLKAIESPGNGVVLVGAWRSCSHLYQCRNTRMQDGRAVLARLVAFLGPGLDAVAAGREGAVPIAAVNGDSCDSNLDYPNSPVAFQVDSHSPGS